MHRIADDVFAFNDTFFIKLREINKNLHEDKH